MKKYNTIIFDLDGTLLNTLEDLADGVNHVMKQYHFPVRTLAEVRLFAGNGIRRLMELSVPQGTENPEFEQAFQTFKEYYTLHCNIKTKPYDGIMELLGQLKKDGCRLAIVSNKNYAAVTELNRIYFHGIIQTAIGEKEHIRKKPAPDTVLQALNELGSAREEALYIGDSEVDRQTAVNVGMDCILVSWGFRDREKLIALKPLGIIDKPEQLLEYL